MRTLQDCRFYGILDTGYCAPDRMGSMLERMIAGGVHLVQLRAKDLAPAAVADLARVLHPVSSAHGVPFILNDYPELVRETGVEGAHVGVDDMSVAEARARAGIACWIGKSSHSVSQAVEGARQGADYLGFGPLFATPTKPDYVPVGVAEIRDVQRRVDIPVFCIGGIKRENLRDVRGAGAERAVIVSGLLLAADVAGYAAECAAILSAEPISG